MGCMSRQHTVYILGCFLTGASLVLMAAVFCLPRDISFRSATGIISDRERSAIDAKHPQDYFIGSSMLHRWIDIGYYEQATHRTSQFLLTPALSSIGIYAQFKNAVMASDYTPQRVFIFYRDPEMTRLNWRIDGDQAKQLEQFMRTEDVDYFPKADYYGAQARRSKLIPFAFFELAMLYDNLPRQYRFADPSLGASQLTALLLGAPLGKVHYITNNRFAVQMLRRNPQPDTGPAADMHYDFDRLVEYSVLPDLIRLAKTKPVTLCFVRVKRRMFADGYEPSQAQLRYHEQITNYFKQQRVCYIDLQDDPRIVSAFYSDGDHIAASNFRAVTDIFIDHLMNIPDAAVKP